MKPRIYVYEDWKKQTVHYRGYTKTYKDAIETVHLCPIVRTTRGAAERDAKKLIATMRKNKKS